VSEQKSYSAALLEGKKILAFRRKVYEYYRTHGRDLPWRKTDDPYRILVSEIMLQQTQVRRVIEKYDQFIRAFPDVESLARAPLRDILSLWQGLGYNRRALAAKRAAERVVAEYHGRIPAEVHSLTSLPGIGNTTASAICAFAFNQPTVFVETNIRAVFIYNFFGNRREVTDSDIRSLVEHTLDRENPRLWYYALMDYGAALKKGHGNPSRSSAHYRRQARFEGSNRQIRGVILRELLRKGSLSKRALVRQSRVSLNSVRRNLADLEKEGLVVRRGTRFSIP
jgi:A/G-specific adenine glycosylase